MEWTTLIGPHRNPYKEEVFEMYERTYAKIGTHIKSAEGLLKYPIWEIALDGNILKAFGLLDKTPYGFKSVLSGTDGSSEAKSEYVGRLKEFYDRPGFFYGEVSHRLKEIAEKLGVKFVDVQKAMEIVRKNGHDPEKVDEKTYRRILQNIGVIEKSMIGHPTKTPMPQEYYAISKRKLYCSPKF